jgi:small-conductance mechanosensitive channel
VPPYSLADPAVFMFVLIPVALAGALCLGVYAASRALGEPEPMRRRIVAVTAAVAAVWMTGTWMAAASGVLREWDAMPPPFGLLVAAIMVLAAVMALTSCGARLARGLPIWLLVAVQGFRFPLEMAMHAMYERGIMPVQMSYSGRNFDIVTGVSALAVAWLVSAGRGGRRLVLLWNVVGLALLVNVVTVAILSTPRFRHFGDDHLNVWVTYPPFVWLPAVMVLAALAGHLVIFRAVRAQTI